MLIPNKRAEKNYLQKKVGIIPTCKKGAETLIFRKFPKAPNLCLRESASRHNLFYAHLLP